MNLTETRIDGDLAYNGHFLKVQRDNIELPDGRKAVREYILHPGAVVVLPLLDDGRVLLERQFRYPLGQTFIEFPAGKIDRNEAPLDSAKRELLEETGYTATDWQFVGKIHNAIAYSDEYLDIYLARGLTAGAQQLDEGEFLELFTATIDELLQWIREGKVTDVKTIIGAFWLDKLRAGDWKLD